MLRIIYRGGYNKYNEESIKKSVVFDYKDIVKNLIKKDLKIAFVTLAKPDGYYEEMLSPFVSKHVDVIDSTFKGKILWPRYSLIFLLGGNQEMLKKGLVEGNFDVSELSSKNVIVGDSAGAFVMGSYMYINKGKYPGENVIFEEGFYPNSNVIVIAHGNNQNYVSEKLVKKVEKFAQRKGIKVLKLNENEEKLLNEEGKFVSFLKEKLFE